MVSRMLAILSLLCAFTMPLHAQVNPSAKRGILDLRNHDFTKSPLLLNGEWLHFPEKLVEPYEEPLSTGYVNLPHEWSNGKEQGVATYRLLILPNRDLRTLAIEIPQLYSAYSLWVNEELLGKNGVVASTRRDTKPQWLPQVITFSTLTDTVSLTLQIANFHHAKGGIKNPIRLGLPGQLLEKQRRANLVNMVLMGVLFFLGVFFLSIYTFAKREKSVLFFALFCLTWGLRSIFSEQYLAIQWMPWFDWELALKIEYITLYLTMMWAIQFIANLYPMDTNKLVKRVLLYSNLLFLFLTTGTPALVYTNLLNVYLLLAGALLIYVVVVILRAMLFERYGAWFSVLGILSLAVAFTYNYLSYHGLFVFSPITFYSLYLVFFFLLAVALAYQLSPKARIRNISDTLSFDDFAIK